MHPRARWHELRGDESAHEVAGLVDHLEQNQTALRERAMASISLYEGRRITSLEPTAYSSAETYEGDGFRRLYMNAARGIVHGVIAKVAGRTRPKTQIVASGADWATKRKGKRLERFVEAQKSQPQGRYRDSWAVCLRVFQDACVAIGKGTLKVFANHEEGKVTVERRLPWETFTDPRETRSGCSPLNRFEKANWDKDLLAARYPNKRDAIFRAGKDDLPGSVGYGNPSSVQVYEAWRLPVAGKGGRHVICIDGTLLDSFEWKRHEFPYIDVYWAEEFLGDGGTSLIEELEPQNDELNYTAERMREAMRLAANVVGTYEEGSVDETLLKSNENGLWIPRQKGSAPPTWTPGGGFGPSDLEWFNLNWARMFELSGHSQASNAGRKEPGVTSGIALRTVDAKETERFSVQATAYEQMTAVDLPRHIIACTRELAEDNPKFAARWKGRGFLQEIPWSDVDMEDDMYELSTDAVSGLVNTPADKLQFAQDMYNGGVWTKDQFLRAVQYKDTESEMESGNSQDALIEKLIEDFLDATPETQESGEFKYMAPIPFMDHQAAMLQMAKAYMQHARDGAPDFNLDFFLRYMSDLDTQIMKLQQRQAEMQAAAQLQAQGQAPAAAMGPASPAGMIQ